jgi:DNA-binding NarL/FixJ family response regulator
MLRIALFEDNNHFRETLELLINSSGDYTCSGVYKDARKAMQYLRQSPADIVLMDIEMPGISGIEATRLIKKEFPDLPVLIQTIFSEDEFIFDAICAGASGYLLKTTSPEGYLEAIKDVFTGGSPMTPGIARRVLELFKKNLRPAEAANYELTTQEKKVLQLLVEGKSYKMIATELYVSLDTVKTHVSHIYSKLQVHSGTEAVSKAIREKLV